MQFFQFGQCQGNRSAKLCYTNRQTGACYEMLFDIVGVDAGIGGGHR